MIEALATAFAQLAIVIAADWSSPERHPGGGQVVRQRIMTPADVWEAFINLAGDRTFDGTMFAGSIHPQWSHNGFMFGHWGF